MTNTFRILLASSVLALAACRSRDPEARPAPRPGLMGPSSAPVMELPRRAALISGESDWSEVGREATELLQQYLRINNTNPPGNEIEAARWLQAVLARDGIEATILEPAPGKANLVARLRGTGAGRPIVLLNHMDVVEATPEFWTVDPFGGVLRDGYIYGRGAVDMKGTAIAQLMAMLVLKRNGVRLTRDLIFLATADEEVGGMSTLGARWIVQEHPELVRGAEFLINEGGGSRTDANGRVVFYGIGTTEKAPFWLGVRTRGTAGHGSRPTRDNSVERLIRALARIEAWETPLTVTPAAQRFFADLAAGETDPGRRAWYADLRTAITDSQAVRFLTSDLGFNAMLRNTISITRVTGSGKVNVIPPEARAEVDVRLLPGQSPQAFLAEIRRVVNDTAVLVEPIGSTWDATESPAETELFRVLAEEMRRRYPDVLVSTPMLAGFTDSHYFRRIGITSYGVDLFVQRSEDAGRAHANDERLAVDRLEFGVRYLYDVLRRLAG